MGTIHQASLRLPGLGSLSKFAGAPGEDLLDRSVKVRSEKFDGIILSLLFQSPSFEPLFSSDLKFSMGSMIVGYRIVHTHSKVTVRSALDVRSPKPF
jgi:hypothetical protein